MIVARRPRRLKRPRKQPRHELQRQILEREGRSVKQFQQEKIRSELHQRSDCTVRETPHMPHLRRRADPRR